MIAMTVLFVVVFLLGTFCSRLSVAGVADGSFSRGPASTVISYLANLATVALLVWGFSVLKWYWPLGCMIVGGGAAQVAIPQMTWSRWPTITPVLDLIVIAGAVILFAWHWPF